MVMLIVTTVTNTSINITIVKTIIVISKIVITSWYILRDILRINFWNILEKYLCQKFNLHNFVPLITGNDTQIDTWQLIFLFEAKECVNIKNSKYLNLVKSIKIISFLLYFATKWDSKA